jgi:hypothetical protein
MPQRKVPSGSGLHGRAVEEVQAVDAGRAAVRSSSSRRSSCSGPFDTTSMPFGIMSQSMRCAITKSRSDHTAATAARWSAPASLSPSVRASSARLRCTSGMAKPPFRPLAPKPTYSRSSTATRSAGSACFRKIAVQSPVYPPPQMATSTVASPRSGGPGM